MRLRSAVVTSTQLLPPAPLPVQAHDAPVPVQVDTHAEVSTNENKTKKALMMPCFIFFDEWGFLYTVHDRWQMFAIGSNTPLNFTPHTAVTALRFYLQ